MNTLVAESVIDNQRLARPEACPLIVYELMLRTWMRYPKNRPTFDDVCYAIAYFMAGAGNILERHEFKEIINENYRDTTKSEQGEPTKRMVRIDKEISTTEILNTDHEQTKTKEIKTHCHGVSYPGCKKLGWYKSKGFDTFMLIDDLEDSFDDHIEQEDEQFIPVNRSVSCKDISLFKSLSADF